MSVTTGQQQWDIVTSVGVTALAVAAARAIETDRDDRLVEDPYAAAFVAAAEAEVPMPTTRREIDELGEEGAGVWSALQVDQYMGVRTRFFDDFFDGASEAGVRQAVILASGLDVRAQRLSWPRGAVVFEIDQPKVREFKRGVLEAQGASTSCELRQVPIDLREDWASALLEAGFDTSAPTAWLAEGLLPYLPQDAQQQLLENVDRLSARGSRLAVEDFGDLSELFRDEEMVELGKQWGVDMRELLHADDRPNAAETLAGFGWSTDSREAEKVAEDHGRSLASFPMKGVGRFLKATKTA
ncbi:SAM-dependent methyltransferase [Saccharopolyspora griseoalba]|uniref:S-adenosyl-L-methionine-dependent methyltransferase n=1 Tax=Saccharopolyspora griseoalba TaxID=1431848 RepID=A0ABW2LEB4_9PSEU